MEKIKVRPYQVVPVASSNPSGIEPTGFRVLVRPVEAPDKIGSIYIPDDNRDKEKHSQQEGVLVAVSPAAFNYDDAIRDKAPQPGNRVLYGKHCGFLRKGSDGVEYRIIEDKDICAVLT